MRNTRITDTKHKGLKSKINFARFYYHKVLPNYVRKLLHIDNDCVVRADIGRLWDKSQVGSGKSKFIVGAQRRDKYLWELVDFKNEKINQTFSPNGLILTVKNNLFNRILQSLVWRKFFPF